MRILDWLGRTMLLVLSGLATMALLTSIASVSDGVTGDPARPRTTEQPVVASIAPDPADDRRVVADDSSAPSPPSDPVADRLEALTWAVLALTGFAAAILLVLLRMTVHLARIAWR